MASSYTVNNGIEKPAAGEQEGAWGGTLNTNFDIIDRVLSGVGSISLSGTTHTLTTTDGTLTDGMYKVLLFTGALGANNTVTISPNDQDKLYFVVNNTTDSGSSGPYSVIVKQGTGATVTVANGAFDIVYADGAGSGAAVTSLLSKKLSTGAITTSGNIIIPDSGNIGSASDTDAMAISSGGVVAFSAVPTFPNDTIETADIQDNAVTLAKMAGLARGKIIYGDASGDPAALAVGSANTFLKTDGTDISWAAGSTAADDISTGDGAVTIATTSGNITIDAQANNSDIIFKGTDATSDITMLTLDGSEAGAATFNDKIIATELDISGNIDVDGTANLDIVDVDGAANFAADVTFADGADIITASAGTSNVRVGVNAGINIASGGTYNVLIGDEAGNDLTTGDYNVAVGYQALDAATTTLYNTAIGALALTTANKAGDPEVVATSNVAVGYYALPNITTGSYNTSCGTQSMQNATTPVSNTAMGYLAQHLNTTGSYNTAHGQQALYSNRTGYGCTAVGYVSMYTNDAAIYNTSVGYQSLYYATAGYNTAVGAFALMGVSGTNDGVQNTCLGYTAGSSLTTGDNNIVIGYNAQPAAATTDNSITLGNSSHTVLRCQQTSIEGLSDRRDKQDIEDLPVGLDFINSLRPVKFTWNMRDGGQVGTKQAGFIAQDLDAAQQEFDAEEYLQLVLKDNPDKLEAAPGKLIPMLVKAVQELSAEVKELKEKLDA